MFFTLYHLPPASCLIAQDGGFPGLGTAVETVGAFPLGSSFGKALVPYRLRCGMVVYAKEITLSG